MKNTTISLEELKEELKKIESSHDEIEKTNNDIDILDFLNKTSEIRDQIIELELDSYSFSEFNRFEQYLINVGVRSAEYSYPEELLFEHIDYFKKCYKEHLSAYKALLFFSYYLEELEQKKSE